MGLFDFLKQSGKAVKSTASNALNTTQEFAKELTSNINNVGISPVGSYSQNGVSATEVNNGLELTYDGILSKSGADKVYAVIGYGNNQKWEDVQYYPMTKDQTAVYKTSIPLTRTGNINVAFKDTADNWDNNSGTNYIFNNQIKGGSR